MLDVGGAVVQIEALYHVQAPKSPFKQRRTLSAEDAEAHSREPNLTGHRMNLRIVQEGSTKLEQQQPSTEPRA